MNLALFWDQFFIQNLFFRFFLFSLAQTEDRIIAMQASSSLSITLLFTVTVSFDGSRVTVSVVVALVLVLLLYYYCNLL
jgi:hypothetical protein